MLRRWLLFRQKVMRVLRINSRLTLRGASGEIVIPLRAGVGMEHLIYPGEKWMSGLLDRLLPPTHPDDLFVDVGVNLGQTLIRLKSVRPEMNYIGFEPNPACTAYLNELIEANDWTNVRICPAGLGARSESRVLSMYDGSFTDSSASLVPDFREATPTGKMTVHLTRWDELEPIPDGTIALLKIDVEGAEWEAIQGIEDAIRRDLPVILIEILPVYSREEHPQRLSRQLALENWSRELGYRWYRIRHDDLERLEEIQEIGIHGRPDWCDYVMLPPANR